MKRKVKHSRSTPTRVQKMGQQKRPSANFAAGGRETL
jgi:hypothetical protein